MPTPLRNVRVPADVWLRAMERARLDGTSLSAVIVAYLREYGAGYDVAPARRAAAGERVPAGRAEPPAPRWTWPEPERVRCRHPSEYVEGDFCHLCGSDI